MQLSGPVRIPKGPVMAHRACVRVPPYGFEAFSRAITLSNQGAYLPILVPSRTLISGTGVQDSVVFPFLSETDET